MAQAAADHIAISVKVPLSRHDRRAIEHTIAALIETLDELDGDPDTEEDDADQCATDLGEGNGDIMMPTMPRYGIDQSRGPYNWRAGLRLYQDEQFGRVRKRAR